MPANERFSAHLEDDQGERFTIVLLATGSQHTDGSETLARHLPVSQTQRAPKSQVGGGDVMV